MFHPYVFVGIPGLPPGKAFERLRSNQGVYLEKPTIPYAELKVRLRFNTLLGMYSFDVMPTQYHHTNLNVDKEELVHDLYDRSLRALFTL
jgi:hypothetical protein